MCVLCTCACMLLRSMYSPNAHTSACKNTLRSILFFTCFYCPFISELQDIYQVYIKHCHTWHKTDYSVQMVQTLSSFKVLFFWYLELLFASRDEMPDRSTKGCPPACFGCEETTHTLFSLLLQKLLCLRRRTLLSVW